MLDIVSESISAFVKGWQWHEVLRMICKSEGSAKEVTEYTGTSGVLEFAPSTKEQVRRRLLR